MSKQSNITTIMQGCQQGDAASQKALVMEASDMLYTVALRYMRQEANARDVLQDAFIRIFKSIHTFDPSRGEPLPWMRKVVVNTALRHLSKVKYTEELTHAEGGDYENIDPEALSTLNAKDILEAVKLLPPMYRKVFNLSVIDGYNHSEISDLLGINESTSRSNLTRAKSLLRTNLLTLEKQIVWAKAT
jgi:RNA polymerase sigma factor (sigma-70 family)